jgi:hypothetical protein
MMSCLLSPVFFYLFLAFGRNSCSLPPPTKNQREKFPPGFIPEQNLSFSLAKIQNDLISFCFWEGETYDENETYLLHRLSDTSSAVLLLAFKEEGEPQMHAMQCNWCSE